jgi:hypothetical protein
MFVQRVRKQKTQENRHRQANGVDEERTNYGGIIGHISALTLITTEKGPPLFNLFLITFAIQELGLNPSRA